MTGTLKDFLHEEEGTSTVEYLTVGAIVIAVGIVAVNALLGSAAGAGTKARGGIDSIPQASFGGSGN
jgi:Flp pilus assembly pilin Flp